MNKKHSLYYGIQVGIALTLMIFSFHVCASTQDKKSARSEHGGNVDSLKEITIHQEVNFSVTPQRIYEVLISSKQFSDCIKKSFDSFTDKSANIDSVAGGAFNLFDGHITGRIVELVPNKRIVEAWRVVDWPDGVYSIAKFELVPRDSGTKLVFDQVGFPPGLKEHLSIGWTQHYWQALTKYFQ
jgi:activator of HSP90 ATPase